MHHFKKPIALIKGKVSSVTGAEKGEFKGWKHLRRSVRTGWIVIGGNRGRSRPRGLGCRGMGRLEARVFHSPGERYRGAGTVNAHLREHSEVADKVRLGNYLIFGWRKADRQQR